MVEPNVAYGNVGLLHEKKNSIGSVGLTKILPTECTTLPSHSRVNGPEKGSEYNNFT